jgi:hypothetical protein
MAGKAMTVDLLLVMKMDVVAVMMKNTFQKISRFNEA